MTDAVDVARASKGVPVIETVRDIQVFALANVLGANLRVALDEASGAERWLGNVCVDRHLYPITLSLLAEVRLPALSVWRTRTQALRNKKKLERRATFAVRYWLDSIPVDWLPLAWPMLHGAFETITRTLTGQSLIDFETVTADGLRAIPSTELLSLAGFLSVDVDTIVGTEDFAGADGGQVYPVLDVSFEAEHEPLFGGLAYSEEFPMGIDLPLFERLCFELWDGTVTGGRALEDQPVVAGEASLEGRATPLVVEGG